MFQDYRRGKNENAVIKFVLQNMLTYRWLLWYSIMRIKPRMTFLFQNKCLNRTKTDKDSLSKHANIQYWHANWHVEACDHALISQICLMIPKWHGMFKWDKNWQISRPTHIYRFTVNIYSKNEHLNLEISLQLKL